HPQRLDTLDRLLLRQAAPGIPVAQAVDLERMQLYHVAGDLLAGLAVGLGRLPGAERRIRRQAVDVAVMELIVVIPVRAGPDEQHAARHLNDAEEADFVQRLPRLLALQLVHLRLAIGPPLAPRLQAGLFGRRQPGVLHPVAESALVQTGQVTEGRAAPERID